MVIIDLFDVAFESPPISRDETPRDPLVYVFVLQKPSGAARSRETVPGN